MAKIVYETPDDYDVVTVDELKYKEETDCWWFYVEDGSNRARYIPRERVYRIERGE